MQEKRSHEMALMAPFCFSWSVRTRRYQHIAVSSVFVNWRQMRPDYRPLITDYLDNAIAFSNVSRIVSDGFLSIRLTRMMAAMEKKKPGTSS